MPLHIQLEDETNADISAVLGKDLKVRLQTAGQVILEKMQLPEGIFEVSTTFLSRDAIRQLNRKYREKDMATDVLSFPMFATLDEIREQVLEAKRLSRGVLLGDVVICTEIACEQAEEYGHSVAREVTYLFVHSLLHLLGFDHENEEEKRKMREIEEMVMTILGLSQEE
ncbi:MAG: rRNA maturation RNase YbeY [Clostridiales Family XIII bacterium]|nr:rRNA maturation RNase YbeY [Clostridiales Family XIII bacterium]